MTDFLFACRFTFVVDRPALRLDGRIAVEVGIGEQAGGRAGVVEDVEVELAVVVPDARAAADDLLELGHRVDDPRQHDVLQVGASTPVVSNCDVVRITGVRRSRSWNRLRCPRPMSPSSDVTRQT